MSGPGTADSDAMQGRIRRVAGQSATYAVGVLAGGLGRVFLIPIVARFLPAADYGIVALVLAFVSMAGILMDLGFSQSLVKFYSEAPDPGTRRRTASTLLLGGMAVGLLLTACLLPGRNLFSTLLFSRTDYVRFVLLGLGLALAASLLRLTLSYFQAKPAPGRYAAVSVVKGALGVGAAAVFVVGLRWGPEGFLAGMLLPPAALALVLLPWVLRSTGLRFDPGVLRRGLRFGAPLVPSTFAMWGLTYCDVYLLGRLSVLEQVGWYQMAQEICLGLGLVVAAVQLAWPRFIFAHAREPNAPRVFALAADYYVMMLAFVGLGLSVFAREILLVIGSRAYLEAAAVIPLLCLATGLFALYTVFASGVQIRGRTEFMAFITAGGLALNIGLNLWMIPRWGMVGAAAASVCANVAMCAGMLGVSHRQYAIPFSGFRLAGIAALAVGLFAASTQTGRVGGPVESVLLRAVLCGVFPLVVFFGFFSAGERSNVRAFASELLQRQG